MADKVKKEITREEVEAAKQEMRKIAVSANREEQLARVINETYQPEYPVADVIGSFLNVTTADPFETIYYFVPTLLVHRAYILSGNCNVTEIQVTPSAKNILAFTTIVTPDYWICLDELLNGDHDVLAMYADDIIESLNREELYSVFQLIDAAAVARGNVLGLSSGNTKLVFPDLVAMKRMVRKYGQKLVLITGPNVTDNIDLLQYDANKFSPVNIKDVVDQWFPVESLDIEINGVAQVTIDPDVAYLIAVSDSKKNKPGYFVRRKIDGAILSGITDTHVVAKERAIIVTGLIKPIAGVEKFAKGVAGFEQVGIVITNPYTIAKFHL